MTMGTTAKGYPYPEGSDFVVDGDDAIQALAEAIDAKVPAATATGTRSMGNIAAGQTKAFAITFPTGLFTVAPVVTIGLNTGNPRGIECGYSAAATSGFNLNAYNSRSTTITSLATGWHAIQIDSAAVVTATIDSIEPDATVTCPTAGCGNEGITIPIVSTVMTEDGTTRPVDGVYCGVCDTDITDTMQPTEGS